MRYTVREHSPKGCGLRLGKLIGQIIVSSDAYIRFQTRSLADLYVGPAMDTRCEIFIVLSNPRADLFGRIWQAEAEGPFAVNQNKETDF